MKQDDPRPGRRSEVRATGWERRTQLRARDAAPAMIQKEDGMEKPRGDGLREIRAGLARCGCGVRMPLRMLYLPATHHF